MKKITHIVTSLVLLFCCGTEHVQYTIQEAATAERTEDFRETEALHSRLPKQRFLKHPFSFISDHSIKLFQLIYRG
jgi:hypothetical protein